MKTRSHTWPPRKENAMFTALQSSISRFESPETTLVYENGRGLKDVLSDKMRLESNTVKRAAGLRE